MRDEWSTPYRRPPQRHRRRRPKKGTAKARRIRQQDRCIDYLVRAGSLADARTLADDEGFDCDLSTWMVALGRLFHRSRTVWGQAHEQSSSRGAAP